MPAARPRRRLLRALPDVFYRSALYNDVERQLGTYHQLDATIGDGSGVFGNIVLSRARRAPFVSDDSQRLAQAIPFLAHAMACETKNNAGSATLPRDHGVLVFDSHAKLRFADTTALHLLWMVTNPAITRADMETKLVARSEFGAQLVKRLVCIEHDEPAPPPSITIRNAWGRFDARARVRVEQVAARWYAIGLAPWDVIEQPATDVGNLPALPTG